MRVETLHEADRVGYGAGFSCDDQIRLEGQKGTESFSYQLMVIDKDNADR